MSKAAQAVEAAVAEMAADKTSGKGTRKPRAVKKEEASRVPRKPKEPKVPKTKGAPKNCNLFINTRDGLEVTLAALKALVAGDGAGDKAVAADKLIARLEARLK